ncbi:MAG: hypothetical protein JNK43_07960 [Ignavibacteria bacterium]|nr:hypothetical protein [Ignavibacteria bacterium]
MAKLKKYLLILILLMANSTNSQQEINKLPKIFPERISKVSIKNIALDLRFDWQKRQAYGTASITVTPVSAIDRFSLDAAFMEINSVRLGTGESLKFDYAGGESTDNLLILLNSVYEAGEALTVVIDYRTNWVNKTDPNNLWGSNGKGLRFSGPTSNDPLRPREIWSMSEPEAARYWFPCIDAPNYLRTGEVKATVDSGLIALSNGILVESVSNSDGTTTFHWKMDKPFPNYYTSIVVGNFIEIEQSYEDIKLHNYGYPDERADIEASVVRLPDMVKFFSEYTGVKYPFSSYSQVFVQELPGGIENSTISTITENMIDDYGTHADFFYLWDGQEAHVLAGQWFGSHIVPADWSHSWLNESFARYFDGLYSEYKNGHDEFLLWNRPFEITTYLADWNSGIRRPIVTKNFENPDIMTRDNYSFVRGSMVLHMLRKQLGDEKFQAAIRNYLSEFGGKMVTTADFQKCVNDAAGENMDWFFDQWVYKMGHPVFEVTQSYDEDQSRLILNIKQTQKPDPAFEYPQADYFKGKMEIEIDGKVRTINIEPKEKNTCSFEMPAKPKYINFDYEGTWIKEVTFTNSLKELLQLAVESKDVSGRSRAITELVNIAGDEKTSGKDKEKIFAALRKICLSDAYWRIKFNALNQLQSLIAPFWETAAIDLDKPTREMLLTLIKNERSWFQAAALRFLGMTRDPQYVDLYISYLNDQSDRVVGSAAASLGKTRSPEAFDALSNLVNRPSMKSQSLMSALNGLKELGDPRGYDIAYNSLADLKLKRWRLPTPPVWDFRIIAAQTIASLGKSESAFPLIFDRFKASMNENDVQGVFNNILLLTALADPRGQEAFDMLKVAYKDDPVMLDAVIQHESSFKTVISQ